MNQKKTIFLSSKISFDAKKQEESLPQTMTMESTRTKTFTKTFDNFGMKHKSMINIFEEINNSERQKYLDCNGGPRFEADNNLIKWSIVGKPDQFLRIFNRKKVQIKTKKLDQSYDEESAPSKPLLQNQQSQALEMKQQRKTPKKNRGDYKIIPRQELLMKMAEANNRIQKNKLQKSQTEAKLPLNIRNIVSREQRIIQHYNDAVEQWEIVNNQVSANCERDPSGTILMRSDQFREKTRKIQALESLKNDEEKFNDRLWYMRLRCYDHKDHRPPFSLITSNKPKTTPYQTRLVDRFVRDVENERLYQQQAFILSDNQNNFGTKIIDNPYQQVETILTPKCGTQKLYSTEFDKMFENKLNVRPKRKFVDGAEYLKVEGCNQFQRELEFIKNDQHQDYQYYEPQNEESAVIESTWNIKQLAKSGEHFYPKYI